MEEKYILVEVWGNKVICNCPYNSLDSAKEALKKSFEYEIKTPLGYYENFMSDNGMQAWAMIKGVDRVWTIIKVPR